MAIKIIAAILMTLVVLTFCLIPFTVKAASIELGWDANKEPDLAGYKVYRNYSTSQPFKLAATIGKVTAYTFSNATTGRRTYYAVTAFNTSGQESALSNLVRVYLMTAPTGLHANTIMGSLTIQ
jgi:fibronectin type 3 domain-containing protein